MKVCTIDDIKAVEGVMKHPDVYPTTADDASPEREYFSAEPLLTSPVAKVLMFTKGIVIVLIRLNAVAWDMHISALKECRGKPCRIAAEKMKAYMFGQTSCEKLVAYVPTFAQNVLKYAKDIGFEQQGYLKKYYKKNGKLYDCHVFGIEKEK